MENVHGPRSKTHGILFLFGVKIGRMYFRTTREREREREGERERESERDKDAP